MDGWVVIHRRVDDTIEFFSTGWADYVAGFGDHVGNYWMGLEAMHIMTQTPHELYVYLETFEEEVAYARYADFSIGDAASEYRLAVSGYTGTAGDSLSDHNGIQFSTIDRNNAGNTCTSEYGAWWYTSCHSSNLNGRYLGGVHESYADGVEWSSYKGYNYSYKIAEMLIRAL